MGDIQARACLFGVSEIFIIFTDRINACSPIRVIFTLKLPVTIAG